MKKLRFKRGITVGLLPKESIVVPENEYWKVLPGSGIATYAKGGKVNLDIPLFGNSILGPAASQTVILPPGTILYNLDPDENSYKQKKNIIGIAFEEVESV